MLDEPVIGSRGPRAVGKTMLLRALARRRGRRSSTSMTLRWVQRSRWARPRSSPVPDRCSSTIT